MTTFDKNQGRTKTVKKLVKNICERNWIFLEELRTETRKRYIYKEMKLNIDRGAKKNCHES